MMKTISCEDMIDIENASLEDVALSRGTSSSSPNQELSVTITTNKKYVLVSGIIIAIGFIAWVFYLTFTSRK